MRNFSPVGIWILYLALVGAAQAQPPERVTVTKTNPLEAVPVKPPTAAELEAGQLLWFAQRTPAEIPAIVVSDFVGNNFSTAAVGVAGADWKSLELQNLQSIIGSMGKRIDWRVYANPDTAPPLAPDIEETTVKVRIGAEDVTELQTWSEETVVLRAEITKAGKLWRIVPDKPEIIFSARGEDAPDIGLVRRLATYLAYPHEAYEWLTAHRSMHQVKLLGLGLLQYTQDADDHYPPTAASFREKIVPYLKDDSLLTSPFDVAGHQSYNLNPYLAGHSLADLAAPAETVAIYWGHDGKLVFREGQTIIGFADGHVQALDAEQVKTLRWKP